MVSEKSVETGCDIRRLRTVSVSTAVPEANSAETVTEVAPAFSARTVCTPEAALTSAARLITAGAASSSVMATAAEAVRPNSEPVKLTLSGDVSSMTSSTGVMVAVVEAVTAEAAKATVKSEMAAKSVPAVAPSPAALKEICVCSANSEVTALGKDTVSPMEVAPALSPTAVGLAVTVNAASSSLMVRLAGLTE